MKDPLCNTCGETNPNNFYESKRSKCKSCKIEYSRQYVEKNRESVLAYKKKYREKNSEYISEWRKKHYQENRDSILLTSKQYREDPENKKSLGKYRNEYNKNKRKSDPLFRLKYNLRNRQGQVLKGKASTTKGLGCTSKELTSYLESQFQEGMTLENYGIVWELDHKIPLSTAELNEKGEFQDSEYNKKLIYYKNLQPLTIEENRLKSDKILDHHLEEFNSENYFDE